MEPERGCTLWQQMGVASLCGAESADRLWAAAICEARPKKMECSAIFGILCVDDFYDGAFYDGADRACSAGGDVSREDFDAEGDDDFDRHPFYLHWEPNAEDEAEFLYRHQNAVDTGKQSGLVQSAAAGRKRDVFRGLPAGGLRVFRQRSMDARADDCSCDFWLHCADGDELYLVSTGGKKAEQ